MILQVPFLLFVLWKFTMILCLILYIIIAEILLKMPILYDKIILIYLDISRENPANFTKKGQ